MTEIVIAFGCEIRDGNNQASVVAYLNANATPSGTDVWSYPKGGSEHRVRIVYTKAEFGTALDQKDAVVIYDGHSRVGQGPAFGPASLDACPDPMIHPVNPWEDNFRMGFDIADIECIGDILHHGTDPPEFPLPANSKSLFANAALRGIVDKAILAGSAKCTTTNAWRTLSACHTKAAETINCRGAKPLASRHYWRARNQGQEYDTLVAVGAADLAKTKLACAVLFMNSCSSKRHYYLALKRHKDAVKSPCVFFVTAEVCSANTTQPFLRAVLAGKDPVKHASALLKRMNSLAESGFISMET